MHDGLLNTNLPVKVYEHAYEQSRASAGPCLSRRHAFACVCVSIGQSHHTRCDTHMAVSLLRLSCSSAVHLPSLRQVIRVCTFQSYEPAVAGVAHRQKDRIGCDQATVDQLLYICTGSNCSRHHRRGSLECELCTDTEQARRKGTCVVPWHRECTETSCNRLRHHRSAASWAHHRLVSA